MKCTLGRELFGMALYDQICEQAIGNYGLITTMDAESLGVKDMRQGTGDTRDGEISFLSSRLSLLSIFSTRNREATTKVSFPRRA